MELRIQYAKTEDGVSIAYSSAGDGQPLVLLSVFTTAHVQRVWDRFPNIFEPLAQGFRLINYDHRGGGLSDRDVTDFSMEAMMRDFVAIVERTNPQSFAVLAFQSSVPIAVTYAASFPDRVSHLILIDGWAKSSGLVEMPASEASEALKDKDWTLLTETLARVLIGFDDPKIVEGFGEYIRGCIEPESYRAYSEALLKWDVTDMLSKVTAQTLVLHNNNAKFVPVSAGRELAAGIPSARFLTIDDLNYEGVASLVGDFVGVEVVQLNSASKQTPGGMTAILFLDIADSTALTTKLGDAAYREKERELDASLRAAITDAGGTPVDGKVLGDGIMSVFTSARQAIDAAQRCRDLGNDAGLPLHLGIHAGDVVREGNNVHGGAVQVAARVQGVSETGEILVSDIVRGLARTSAGVAFEDRGEHELKGIDEPQRLFAVRVD